MFFVLVFSVEGGTKNYRLFFKIMLSQIENLISNLKSFSFEQEQSRLINDNKEKIADLQAQQWAETSTDYADRPLRLLDNPGGGYKPQTVFIKRLTGIGLGGVTDRVTNYQTGALFSHLKAVIEGEKFFTTSDVSYFKKLMRREGNPQGLNEDSRIEFAESVVKPGIREALKRKTGLTF